MRDPTASKCDKIVLRLTEWHIPCIPCQPDQVTEFLSEWLGRNKAAGGLFVGKGRAKEPRLSVRSASILVIAPGERFQRSQAAMPQGVYCKPAIFSPSWKCELVIACCCICRLALSQDTQGAVPNYKELIYGTVKSSFLEPSSVGVVEISPLHPARPPQWGDWMACLRISIDGQPVLYAAFIEGWPPRVFLLRRAVRFDNCDHDQYEPISSSVPAGDRQEKGPRGQR